MYQPYPLIVKGLSSSYNRFLQYYCLQVRLEKEVRGLKRYPSRKGKYLCNVKYTPTDERIIIIGCEYVGLIFG